MAKERHLEMGAWGLDLWDVREVVVDVGGVSLWN